jgi:hypothetical protein
MTSANENVTDCDGLVRAKAVCRVCKSNKYSVNSIILPKPAFSHHVKTGVCT